jgi:large subunit ribosomal protein LP0
MGKNTMMKRSIKEHSKRTGRTEWLALSELLVGNVGVIFTVSDLAEVRDMIMTYKVPAPARVGGVAPVDVIVPAGGTGMDPSQTNFFQVLNIATKINKGAVEIVADVHLVKAGDKVGSSEAALLSKLKILPFSYGLKLVHIYDNGAVYDPKVLDINEAQVLKAFAAGIANIASVSLEVNYPTAASVPHSIINGYKNVLSVAVETDYTFPLADKVKAYLANPGAFAAAAPAAAPAAGAAPAKKEEKKVEVEEEEEVRGPAPTELLTNSADNPLACAFSTDRRWACPCSIRTHAPALSRD